jgi:hypothetical protein
MIQIKICIFVQRFKVYSIIKCVLNSPASLKNNEHKCTIS